MADEELATAPTRRCAVPRRISVRWDWAPTSRCRHDAGLPLRVGPQQQAGAALASQACGAARFAYNWGLALVKARLSARERIREAALREGLSRREADAMASTVPVPWTAYDLRREWNRHKDEAAPWWRQNSKEAANTGLFALATALKAWGES